MIVPAARSSVPTVPVKSTKLLLVEGAADAEIFESIAKELGKSAEVEIRYFEGKDKLGTYLKTIAATSDFLQVNSLGIVQDADDDPTRARGSVEQALNNANLKSYVRRHVLIVPGGDRNGVLETLFVDANKSDLLYSCVESFEACLVSKGGGFPPTNDADKHRLQVFLATKPKAVISTGLAAKLGLLSLSDAAFNGIREFVRDL
jgi:hypothetical protein